MNKCHEFRTYACCSFVAQTSQFCGVLAQMRSASCHQNAMFSEKSHLTEQAAVKIA